MPESLPHSRVTEARALAEWVIEDPRRVLLPEQSENLARAVLEAQGLVEQLQRVQRERDEAFTLLKERSEWRPE